MLKAIQQFQLRASCNNMDEAMNTLSRVKVAGYDAIELNGFMIRKSGIMVKVLTRLAGMPVGKSGNLDWDKLIKESGLKVISLHEHLGSILNNPQTTISDAKRFNTKFVVITGMHQFDYSNKEDILKLCDDLNNVGKTLKEAGLELLYHNHNCELRYVDANTTAYDLILEKTNPEYVNFEFDSYWMAEAGVDVISMMKRLDKRMRLHHINDRGVIANGKTGSILKSDSKELGYGNMNLVEMIEIDKELNVEAVILEQHKNWINNSGIESAEVSSKFMNKYVR